MNLDPYNLMLISLVALVTLAMRMLGSLIMARASLGPVATAAFEAMPLAVLTAVAAPAVVLQGWPEALAGCLAVLAGLRAPAYVVIGAGMAGIVLFRALLS